MTKSTPSSLLAASLFFTASLLGLAANPADAILPSDPVCPLGPTTDPPVCVAPPPPPDVCQELYDFQRSIEPNPGLTGPGCQPNVPECRDFVNQTEPVDPCEPRVECQDLLGPYELNPDLCQDPAATCQEVIGKTLVFREEACVPPTCDGVASDAGVDPAVAGAVCDTARLPVCEETPETEESDAAPVNQSLLGEGDERGADCLPCVGAGGEVESCSDFCLSNEVTDCLVDPPGCENARSILGGSGQLFLNDGCVPQLPLCDELGVTNPPPNSFPVDCVPFDLPPSCGQVVGIVNQVGRDYLPVPVPCVGIGLPGDCQDTIDTDLDRLSDCVEVDMLGTDPDNPETDGDGIIDWSDFQPQNGASVRIPVEVSLVGLNRIDPCEYREGNKWDPYIGTAFVKLPLTSGDVVDSFSRRGTGLDSRSSHDDGRPSGPLRTPPTVTVEVPQDYLKFRVPGLGAYPFFQLNVGLTEHDVQFDNNIRLAINGNGIVEQLPIAVETANRAIHLQFSGQGSECDGALDVTVNSPVDWASMMKSVIASTKGPGEFVTVPELRAAMGGGVCPALLFEADSGSGGVATSMLCQSAPDLPTESLAQAASDELASNLDLAPSLADLNDPDHPVIHAFGALPAPRPAPPHPHAPGTPPHTHTLPAVVGPDVDLLYGLAPGTTVSGKWAVADYRILAPDGAVLDAAGVKGQDATALSRGAWDTLPGTQAAWAKGSRVELSLRTDDGKTLAATATLPERGLGEGMLFLELNPATKSLTATPSWTDTAAFLAKLEP